MKNAKNPNMNKAELHEAMLRDGYYLPSYSSTIVSKKWLEKVLNQEEWCPKYFQIRIAPCTKAPLKQFFISEILQILNKQQLIINITDKHQPDLEWCKYVLSTLNPNHLYFQKQYYPSDEELGIKNRKFRNEDINKNQFHLIQGMAPQIFSKRKQKQIIQIQQSVNDEESEENDSQDSIVQVYFAPQNEKINTQNQNSKMKSSNQTSASKDSFSTYGQFQFSEEKNQTYNYNVRNEVLLQMKKDQFKQTVQKFNPEVNLL